MQTTAHLDYIGVSYPASIPTCVVLPGAFEPDRLEPSDKRRMKNYKNYYENEFGVAFFESFDVRQGNHLILSGEPLAKARERGCTDDLLMGHIKALTPKFSRVDVALNLHDSYFTAGTMERWYKAGKIATKARGGKRIYGLGKMDNGLYIGSRRSERMLRVYDKAAEQKLADTSWVRVELECHGQQARKLAFALADNLNPRAVINLAINNFCAPPPRTDLAFALADRDATIEPVVRKEPAFIKWLRTQVAPAMVRYEQEHPGTDALALLEAFADEYRNYPTS